MDLQDYPTPQAATTEPMVSAQSQIGLVLTAAVTVIALVFHKDYSSIVPALAVVAFAVYGGAIAIARAFKHKTNVQAQTAALSMAYRAGDVPSDEYARHDDVVKAFNVMQNRLELIEAAVAPMAKGNAGTQPGTLLVPEGGQPTG